MVICRWMEVEKAFKWLSDGLKQSWAICRISTDFIIISNDLFPHVGTHFKSVFHFMSHTAYMFISIIARCGLNWMAWLIFYCAQIAFHNVSIAYSWGAMARKLSFAWGLIWHRFKEPLTKTWKVRGFGPLFFKSDQIHVKNKLIIKLNKHDFPIFEVTGYKLRRN